MPHFDDIGGLPVIQFDFAGEVIQANEAAQMIFGLEAEDRRPVWSVLPRLREYDLGACIREDREESFACTVGQRMFHLCLQGSSEMGTGRIEAFEAADLGATRDHTWMLLELAAMGSSEELFKTIATLLASNTGAKAALVVEVVPGPPAQGLLAAAHGWDAAQPGVAAPLEGTVFEHVLRGAEPSWVREQHPLALPEAVGAKGAWVSYLGLPLTGRGGKVVGLLAVLEETPIEEPSRIEPLMRLLAGYTARELERRQQDREQQLLLRQYELQMKELQCIFGLAEAIRTRETLDQVCEDLVRIVPEAWQFPKIARARIILDNKVFVSGRFEETAWGQSAAIIANGRARGMVQVFYLEGRYPHGGDGPFVSSERNLLDALARTLGEAIQRREAEAATRDRAQELARERNQLATILQSIADGVVVTDVQDRIVLINPAAEELLGLEPSTAGDSPEERSAHVGADFLGVVRDDGFRARWRRSEGAWVRMDLRVEGPVARTLEATRSPIPDLPELDNCYVTILHDVTKEREINQLKTDFVSTVSHELRTPMTAIKGFATTLRNKPDMPNELRQHFLGIISEEADRLTSMIEDVLLISRIDSGQLLLERSPVNVADMAARIESSLKPFIESKNLTFRKYVAKDLPQPYWDGEKIHMAVYNLVDNAIKYTPEGGRVTLRASVAGDNVLLRVRDTGAGIARDQRKRIFERFHRVRRPNDQTPGTGLGLFIVKEMVTLHGGAVTAESQPGKGSVFTMELPIHPPARRQEGEEQE